MKRKELTVGLEVEVQQGREHRSYERAVVLAVEPWMKQEQFRLTAFRPVRYDHEPKTGVAVAVERAPHFHRGKGLEWQPDVVPLSKLVPVGSKADYEAERDAGRKARQERQDAVAEHQRRLTARTEALVGSTGVWLRDSGTVVEVGAKAFERLLDMAERHTGETS